MKKYLVLLTVLLLALCLVFVACDKKDDKTADTTTEANTTEKVATLEATTTEEVTTAEVTTGPLQFLDQTIEVWSFEGLPTETMTADGTTLESRDGNAKIGEAWNFRGKADGGFENSFCLEIEQLKTDWRYDAILYFNDKAVKDWTGAKEVWLYIDAEDYLASFKLDLGLVDSTGLIFPLSRDKQESPVRGPIYFQWEDGWEEGALNDWGHAEFYPGFKGFVRIPVSIYSGAKVDGVFVDVQPVLTNMLGISIYFEDYSSSSGTIHIDSLRIMK